MPTTPGCQPAPPTTIAASRAGSNHSASCASACRSTSSSTPRRSRFCSSSASAMSDARCGSSVSSSSSASCAVPSRPAAFRRGPSPKPIFAGVSGGRRPGHVDQFAQADPVRAIELLEPAADERAIFGHQRHEIGHGAERHEIEILAQIEARQRPAFQQRVGDFEDDADAAQVMVIAAELRIHQRGAGGQRVLALVMIEHDHVHARTSGSRRFPPPSTSRNPRR